MGTASAIFNHALTAGQALKGQAATRMDGSTSGTSGASGSSSNDTSGNSATISANDFLTLLVTEMQNQDPTADTDPNEYINQLVQVNSLEQLIDINQTLSGAVNPASSGSSDGASSQAAPATNTAAPSAISAAQLHALHAGHAAPLSSSNAPASTGSALTRSPGSSAAQPLPGNLGAPAVNNSALRVGHALNGQGHLKHAKGNSIALQ